MVYLILGLILVVCILILWGLGLLLIKKPYVFAILIVSLYAFYEFSVYQFHLNFLPEGLGVWKQLYANEKAWGIGIPGDNETGLIEFELPSSASDSIKKRRG